MRLDKFKTCHIALVALNSNKEALELILLFKLNYESYRYNFYWTTFEIATNMGKCGWKIK